MLPGVTWGLIPRAELSWCTSTEHSRLFFYLRDLFCKIKEWELTVPSSSLISWLYWFTSFTAVRKIPDCFWTVRRNHEIYYGKRSKFRGQGFDWAAVMNRAFNNAHLCFLGQSKPEFTPSSTGQMNNWSTPWNRQNVYIVFCLGLYGEKIWELVRNEAVILKTRVILLSGEKGS